MTNEQHRRVLVVDDDSTVRGILVTALRQRGLVVDQAEDGREAIDLVREHSYSVVLLDLLMPVTDGFEVLKTLHGDHGLAAPVVLVVTGADRMMIEQLDSKLIHGIVKKPFDPQEVSAVVAACADLRGRGAFETMALATMLSGAPLFAWWASNKF
ncbi:MAG: response regulator [Acidobacteria bacterium]|nr:response regulator [Acidobacteriota bacterium]MBV9476919.1 response regulator [Acidobacteriota bacterium]